MHLRFEIRLPIERDALFRFHTDPDNLLVLIRGWQGLELIEHAGHVRPGAQTRIRERLGPFRISMTFEHHLFEPPTRFGERLVRGPFHTFEHVHEFEAREKGTTVRDVLTVRLPLWLGGELATRWVVAPKIRRFFQWRHQGYERLREEGRWGEAPP